MAARRFQHSQEAHIETSLAILAAGYTCAEREIREAFAEHIKRNGNPNRKRAATRARLNEYYQDFKTHYLNVKAAHEAKNRVEESV